MTDEELISKKELLLATGISYGQLYRWKRQQLIPDSWFIKLSSYTGQETYFPKQKILERIRTILDLKDSHSLEELAAFFSPEIAGRTYLLLDAIEAVGLKSSLVDLCIRMWGKYRVSFMELLLLYLLPDMEKAVTFAEEDRKLWLATAGKWANTRSGTEQTVILFRKGGSIAFLLLDAPGRYELDAGCEPIAAYDLSEYAKQLQLKLHQFTEGR